MQDYETQNNSSSWLLYVKAAFGLSIASMALGIVFMPAELMVQGYFAINTLFLISATITLSKTMRDEHEAQRLLNRISEAKTQKILKEYSE